jgi:hypothetical protein
MSGIGAVSEREPRDDRLSRRRFVTRGAGAALGAATVSGSVVATAGLSAPGALELTPARKRLYAALVEAVGSTPGTLVDPSASQAVVKQLATLYGKGNLELQTRVDAALDSVEHGSTPGAFASMSVAARVHHLRALLVQREPGLGLHLATASSVTEAIGLAAAPFDPRGFTWSLAAADLWVRAVKLFAAGSSQ